MHPTRSKVADLHLEALGFVVERPDGPIELRCEELQRVIGGKPRVQCVTRRLPEAAKLGAAARDMWRFIEQHQVQGQVIEVLPTTIQIRRAALDRLVRDGLFGRRSHEGTHHPFQQVLVDPAVFVQESEGGFEAMCKRLPLGVRQALVVHAPNPVREHRVLICDRDAKWSEAVRQLLSEGGLRVVQTPWRAPNANAHAERFVRSIKQECLDRVIPLGERHFRQTLAEYVDHYHRERNHQGLANALIEVLPNRREGPVRRRLRLGGLLNYYDRAA